MEREKIELPIAFIPDAKSFEKLGFKAEHTVEDMCRDAYNFVNHKEN